MTRIGVLDELQYIWKFHETSCFFNTQLPLFKRDELLMLWETILCNY